MAAGVPLIGLPMLDDQWYNADKYLPHKIDPRLNIDTLTVEKFDTAIKTVLNDNSYRENIVTLRELMFEQPRKPLDRAVWWSEHVLRHDGARHLASPAANISVAQNLQLQPVFVLFIVLLAFVVLYIFSKAISIVLRFDAPAVIEIKKS